MSRIIFESVVLFTHLFKALPETFKAHLIESCHAEKKLVSLIVWVKSIALPTIKIVYTILEIVYDVPGFHNFLFKVKNVH